MTKGTEAYFEDHSASTDIGRLALRGGVLVVAMQYGNAALQIVAAIALARLLAVEDFGLVAIVAVLTSFAPPIIDFGLAEVTAQRKTITRSQISSLFWLSAAIGLSVAVVVAASSPLIAMVYRDPRLEAIALCSAISFVLWGVSNLHLGLLQRTMQFGTIARIQISSNLVGIIVAVSLALAGYSYWALVARPIITALCVALGVWNACRWRPGWPSFDREVKSMVRFGLNVAGFSVTYAVAKAVDRIALGLFYRPDVVGYYQNATLIYEHSINLALHQLHSVGAASLSKLQSNPALLRQNYEAAMSTLAFFMMPTAAILSVTAEDATVLLLGEKWRPAGLLLTIIALRGIFGVVEGSQGWLHVAIGRVDRWQNWGFVTLAVQIVAIFAGLPFGATGVAAASVIALALIAVPSISYAGAPIGVCAALVVRAVGRQLIGAISIVAAGWYFQSMLTDYSVFMRILLSGALCTGLYLAVVVGLFRLTEPIRVVASVVQDLFKVR